MHSSAMARERSSMPFLAGALLVLFFIFGGSLLQTGLDSFSPIGATSSSMMLSPEGSILDRSLPTEALTALPADDTTLFCHHAAHGPTPSWECDHSHPALHFSSFSSPIALAAISHSFAPPSPIVFSKVPGIPEAKLLFDSSEPPPRSLPLL